VRVIGASTNRPPASFTSDAMRAVDAGTAVEQSITIVPGCNPASTPSGAVSTASTSGDPVTHRMTMSDSRASASPFATVFTPPARSSSSG
jgi:hypothetical protein